MDWIEQTEDAKRKVDYGNVTTTHHIQGHQVVGIVVRSTETYRVANLPEALDIVGSTVLESGASLVTGTIEIKLHYDQGRIKTVNIDRPT